MFCDVLPPLSGFLLHDLVLSFYLYFCKSMLVTSHMETSQRTTAMSFVWYILKLFLEVDIDFCRIGQETLVEEDDWADDDIEKELAPITVQLAYVQQVM